MAHEVPVMLIMYQHSIERLHLILPQIMVGLSYWSGIIGTELQSSPAVINNYHVDWNNKTKL